jgi:hypothetical protein
MKRALMYMLCGLLLVWTAAAQNTEQSPPSQSPSNSPSVGTDQSGMQTSPGTATQGSTSAAPGASSSGGGFAAGTVIGAELSKSIDAKKAKAGDQFTAIVLNDLRTDSGVTIPRGSKLIGHVTEAKPHAKGESDSVLGIAFDKIEVKKGPEIPVHAAIQAVARPQTAPAMEESGTSGGNAGSAPNNPGYGGMPAGRSGGSMASPPGSSPSGSQGPSAAGMPAGTSGQAGGADSNGGLTSASRGVLGIEGVSLTPQANQGSVLTSSRGNVHLDSGTQMVLRVTTQ